MLNILPENMDHETPLTDAQCKGWSFIIHQLNKEQLPGLRQPLPAKPKTISNVLDWLEHNQNPSINSMKLTAILRPLIPLSLYILGALWLQTIFSTTTIVLYLLPALCSILWIWYQKHTQNNQLKRYTSSEHIDDLITKLVKIQADNLQQTSNEPSSFTTSEGLLFSYMQQTDQTNTLYHILSFRSTIDSLAPKSLAFLTLIAKQCFPRAEAPIVFQTKKDIFHLLYTHESQTSFVPPQISTEIDIEELLSELWIVRCHQQGSQTIDENNHDASQLNDEVSAD